MLVCGATDVPAHVLGDVPNFPLHILMFQTMFRLMFLLPQSCADKDKDKDKDGGLKNGNLIFLCL